MGDCLYKRQVAEVVRYTEEFCDMRGQTLFVTKKQGVVVCRNSFTPDYISRDYVAAGKYYPILPNCVFPKRTVFRKNPINIEDRSYYLELKGYGANGKELYFQEHESGDVFFGMYLERALHEFKTTTQAVKLGLSVSLPIAAVRIPRPEYLRKGLIGFEKTMSAFFPDSKTKHAIHKLIHSIIREFDEDLEQAVDFIVSELDNAYTSKYPLTIKDAAKAMLSRKPVGYYIRASKCPLRVGDPSDKDIDSPENHGIAKNMGYSFRKLIENGILHHCPGTGNWTIAGELTDFADTFYLNTQQKELKEHMHSVKKDNLEDFISYIIGPEHTGVLCSSFLTGMHGQGTTIEQATKNIIKLF